MRRSPVFAAVVVVAGAGVGACGPSARDVGDDDNTGTVDAGPDVDAATSDIDARDDIGANAAVFAHTATTLYRVDPITYAVSTVGDFQWPAGADQMTDIAIDRDGNMIGVSFSKVYRVDAETAACTQLSGNLSGLFNGLSFVPSMLAFGIEGPDVLVGIRNLDGQVFQVDPNTGATTQIGDMGAGYMSSGDIVAVDGFGMVATVPTGTFGNDRLVRLAPTTFAATPLGNTTGFSHLWGVGFWGNRVFGFSDGGVLTTIDPATGLGTQVATAGPSWWGAAVTTIAPVIP